MNPEAVFNRYDIRGSYPDEIDDAFAEQLGKAVGVYANENHQSRVIVGRDTRDASDAVHPAFIQGVRSTGTGVVDTGIGTTDRTAVATQHYGGIGVMITASHHAWDRTGFKLLYPKGNGFTNTDLERVKTLFHTDADPTTDGTLLGVQHECDETYIERALETFSEYADSIDAHVVLDAVGGAERVAPALFEELGATTTAVPRDTVPDPEPREESRNDVATHMVDAGADIAVGYDPDGDRVHLIHPELGWVGGDHLFYALAHITGAEQIVASADTSPLIEELPADITYTRVGDVFVAAEGVEQDADLLGEPNGHYAVPAFSWYNSGIFASLLLAAHHDELVDILEPVNDFWTERFVEEYEDMAARDAAMQQVKKQIAQHFDVTSRVDGIKFEGDTTTGMVRPSGTSPKIRLIVYGRGDSHARAGEVQNIIFASG